MPGENVCLEDMDMFNEHLVLFLNKNGCRSICSIPMPFGVDRQVFVSSFLFKEGPDFSNVAFDFCV